MAAANCPTAAPKIVRLAGRIVVPGGGEVRALLQEPDGQGCYGLGYVDVSGYRLR